MLEARVATPELLRVATPICVLPCTKVTVPVAMGPEAEVTFAVKVTDLPNVEGFGEVVTMVVVLSWFTVCVPVAEVLPKSSMLPL